METNWRRIETVLRSNEMYSGLFWCLKLGMCFSLAGLTSCDVEVAYSEQMTMPNCAEISATRPHLRLQLSIPRHREPHLSSAFTTRSCRITKDECTSISPSCLKHRYIYVSPFKTRDRLLYQTSCNFWTFPRLSKSGYLYPSNAIAS